MTAKQFVLIMQSQVIDQNLCEYKRILLKTNSQEANDPYWLKTVALYNSLNTEQKLHFDTIMRQIMVDTTSNILGILDGSSFLDNYRGEFCLTTDDSGEKINGDLQDVFLSQESD
jgi:hypothetical protein